MSNVVTWLAATIRGAQPGWLFDAGLDVDDLVAKASKHGVVALTSWRLQQGQIPVKVFDAFAAATRKEALYSMLLEAEARRVLETMQNANIPGLLLKGSALSQWAYFQPHLRACSDVDLLLPSRAVAEQLSGLLTNGGYKRAETSGELVAYELLCTRLVIDNWQVEIDMHWCLTNSTLFCNAFTFDELMDDSIPLPRLAPNARGLGPVHALLHACMHRALNLSIGVDDKLKWLYDLIVLMDAFRLADWQRVVDLSLDKKLAGVVLSGLQVAASTFDRVLPAEIVVTLKHASAFEPLDARRLSDWNYMQRKTFQALPSLALRLRWIWQRIFPSRDYMAYLYEREHQGYASLMAERLRRAVRRIGG